MLGILCARHKPCILSSLSLAHTSPAALTNRVAGNQIRLVGSGQPLRLHSGACRLSGGGGVAASIWHAILPSGGVGRRPAFHNMRGEGSWNVAWDARPARWLHRLDSAWLLFGVCACRAAPLEWADVSTEAVVVSDDENCNGCGTDNKVAETNYEGVAKHRVTGDLHLRTQIYLL
ncbi:Wiskott-Aldrich syndrome protein [Actinidia chinensis var. chinensis]|uniref:Wiskott-Aldrich syndrome protein n=1 Tax=Actinidia chinensis var. chinensis TaxID=1590841 RepID=A0A2R6PKX8_ACTCC|nr:Wiskott-Aldrich syndrome protein [Actinidia chinensis var. chinensis]